MTELFETDPIVLYTAKDLERIFGCCRRQSYEIMHSEGFPSFQIRGRFFVRKDRLLEWMNQKEDERRMVWDAEVLSRLRFSS